jgi:DNA-binding FadR family transcriptional regulator
VNPEHGHRNYRHTGNQHSLHGRIVRALGQRIVAGELKPGQRLPLEATLLAEFGASRPVLREAVRVLGAKGLLQSRQRAGATVRPRNEWHLLDPDVLYWLIQSRPPAEFVQTLLGVRRIFEPACAALAARVAGPAQRENIAEAYARMEAARTPEELLEPDLAFHSRIAEATGNDLLSYIGHMLSLGLRESIQLSSRHPNTHALSLPRHKAILTAIIAGDPLAAQQASLVQLQETRDDLAAILGTALETP